MAGPRTQQLLVLRLRLASGATWRDAAGEAGLALSTAWEHATRLWPSLSGRRPRFSPMRRASIERAILDAPHGVSYRAIARAERVSPDTISRLARAMVERQCAGLAPARQVPTYRCPGCGQRVTIAPCVYCRAKESCSRNSAPGAAGTARS